MWKTRLDYHTIEGMATTHPGPRPNAWTTAMIYDRYEEHPGARFLLVLASAVVVTWGLQFAAPILLPMAVALFLAVLTFPLVHLLRERRVPAATAILLSVLLVVGSFSLLGCGACRVL